MWEYLRRIQEDMYGTDNEVLVYTYKNIGVCYLGLGVPDKAEEYYNKSLEIMERLKEQGAAEGITEE
jgi:Tfp pilus assembly protein PilF